MSNLIELNLGNNLLKEVPVISSTRLKILDLRGNKIAKIFNNSFDKLVNLETLILSK